jgi:hypothetical protein
LAGVSITDLPAAPDFVRFREDFGTKFVVTIDTEEEFDWGAPLRREGHGLDTISAFARFQQFCESFGVVPIYLLDFPVAASPATAEMLRGPFGAGRAEIGIHLHPWVNPPFEEEVSERNSFAGNLGPELEREKFRQLRDTIAERLGVTPRIYRAGRYGVGPNSATMLAEAGIPIDTSVRARFDYSHAGGPNFRGHPLRPYWLDRQAGLMELPLTTVFSGLLRGLGDGIYPRLWRAPSLRGVLSHAGLLERIPLTPEGISVAEAVRAIDLALADGLPVLVFSFHSPSLAPGNTPYVRSARDLDAFYDWWRQVFEHLARRRVAPSSVADILASRLPSA